MQKLRITSPSFGEGDWIPKDNSARGRDISPEIRLEGICEKAESIAVTMDDSSHPLFPNYNHWIIWNLPVQEVIPAAVSRGKNVPDLENAIQGIAYGRHRYKGPKPPLKSIHTYTFTVYVLDIKLSLSPGSRKKDLLDSMKGHVLQKAVLSGKFQSHRKERQPSGI